MGGILQLQRNTQDAFELELVAPSGPKNVARMLAEDIRKELGIKGSSTMDQGSMSEHGYSRTLSLKGMTVEFEGHKYDKVDARFYVSKVAGGDAKSVFAQVDFIDAKSNTVIAGWTHPEFRALNNY